MSSKLTAKETWRGENGGELAGGSVQVHEQYYNIIYGPLLLLPTPHRRSPYTPPSLFIIDRCRAIVAAPHRSTRIETPHTSAPRSLGTRRNTLLYNAFAALRYHVPAVTIDAWRTRTTTDADTDTYTHTATETADVELHTPPENAESQTHAAMELPQQPNLRVTSTQEHVYRFVREQED
jgi:hypothetical protein